MHPLHDWNPKELYNQLKEREDIKHKRIYSDSNYDLHIFKYVDRPKIANVARLARGQIFQVHTEYVTYFNLHMPKFDELVNMCKDSTDYYDRMYAKLLQFGTKLSAETKVDGTNIHAIRKGDSLFVTSFLTLGDTSETTQASKAKKMLEKLNWRQLEENLTISVELIWHEDAKVTKRRGPDNLYLLYASDSNFNMKTSSELDEIARKVGLCLPKKFHLHPQEIIDYLISLDKAKSLYDLQEGLVVECNGEYYKVKSFLYLLLSHVTIPSHKTLLKIISQKKMTIEKMLDLITEFDGPLDSAEILDNILVDVTEEVKKIIADISLLKPSNLYEKMKRNPEWIKSDEAFITLVKHVCNNSLQNAIE